MGQAPSFFYFPTRLGDRVISDCELKHVVEKEKEKDEGQIESWGRERKHRERPHERLREHTWEEREITIEAEEGVGGGADFLLHGEVVIQGHLLHPCHQAFIRVHCSHTEGNQQHVQTCHQHAENKILY